MNDVYVRSLADNVDPFHQSVFENLLISKVDNVFTETLFGQTEFSSSYMIKLSEGSITESLNYLDQSCIKLIPPYVIQKIDNESLQYLRHSYQTFLPHVDLLEIPQFCCRYEVVNWWSECLRKYKYSKRRDQVIRAFWPG